MTERRIGLFPEIDEEEKRLAALHTAPAKPFMNWLGGKKQLLHATRRYYPGAAGFESDVYIEPFVGGGAVLFDVLEGHSFKKIVINDFDPNPINCYRIVRDNVDDYIDAIHSEQELFESKEYDQQSEHYYRARDEFNALKATDDPMRKAVLAIFLNRVSFNSLYRMNAKGEMNASWSKGLKKFSVDFQNLQSVSKLLNENNVIIENTSYENLRHHFKEAGDSVFAFFDPPYRALTKTANFNKYGNAASQEKWDDAAQLRLRDFVDDVVDNGNVKFLLTNSDPKNSDPDDDFFEDAYRRYDIDRVDARRNISVTNSGRAAVKELFISNIPSSRD